MRRFLIAGLSLLAPQALACTVTDIMPEGMVDARPEDLEQYFLERDFDRATVVLEATVSSLRQTEGFILAKLNVAFVWKADGLPLDYLFIPKSDTCNPDEVLVSRSYFIFAKRAPALLASVGAPSEPITPVFATVRPVDERASLVREILRRRSIVWVAPPSR
jgi:hypothetical protein